MKRELLMRAEGIDTAVAVIEDGQMVELYMERESDDRMVGSIYKGVVKNVLPGMQAAFVDIQLEKNAFLYVDDIPQPMVEGDNAAAMPIQSLLKEGQEVMVQITKEPVGTKGARITAQITLPGRFLVLMPTTSHIAVSRRIQDPVQRQKLYDMAVSLKPDAMGLIVRTIGEGATFDELEQDRDELIRLWAEIEKSFDDGKVRGLVFRDDSLCQRVLRDMFSTEISRLMVNSRALHNEVLHYLDRIEPDLKRKVFVSNMEEMYEKYAIYQELRVALDRKVWMKNGSYLIFDQTEALTVIDVNTGRYVGGSDLAETILQTNIEAAKEIARQLRIRNIGGIIIIDFIDVEVEHHKKRILDVLAEELKKDRVRTHLVGFTGLGLVEMTRKKVRQTLDSSWEMVCPQCEGKGRVPVPSVVFSK